MPVAAPVAVPAVVVASSEASGLVGDLAVLPPHEVEPVQQQDQQAVVVAVAVAVASLQAYHPKLLPPAWQTEP